MKIQNCKYSFYEQKIIKVNWNQILKNPGMRLQFRVDRHLRTHYRDPGENYMIMFTWELFLSLYQELNTAMTCQKNFQHIYNWVFLEQENYLQMLDQNSLTTFLHYIS
jgi:hypothetical protein